MADSPKATAPALPADPEKSLAQPQGAQERTAATPQDEDASESGSNTPGTDEASNKPGGTDEGDDEQDGEGEEDDANPPLPDEPVPTENEWQAIWSPSHNAYYFYNSRTAETTWVNPLDPASSASSSAPAPDQPQEPQSETKPEEKKDDTVEQPPQDLSYLNGIDPELAYLDPTLAVPPTGAKGPVPTFLARFGARSGKFTAMDGRAPEHLSEAARAQRMSSVYFDTEAWEREIAERDAKAKADEEAGIGKRKRLTKADIERFKEQKKAKKAMRNAWLRE